MAHLILIVTWPLLSWQPHYPCYGILKATWSLFWYFDSYMVPVLVFWQPYDPYYNILTATWSLFQYFDSHMIPVLVFWQPRDRCSGIFTTTWSLFWYFESHMAHFILSATSPFLSRQPHVWVYSDDRPVYFLPCLRFKILDSKNVYLTNV